MNVVRVEQESSCVLVVKEASLFEGGSEKHTAAGLEMVKETRKLETLTYCGKTGIFRDLEVVDHLHSRLQQYLYCLPLWSSASAVVDTRTPVERP